MPQMRDAERARLFHRAKQALRARREEEDRVGMTEQPKLSRYLQAGSPISCFLPSCRKPFLGTCVRGSDGHFYCSNECADEGDKVDLSRVEQLQVKAKA